MMDIKLQLIQLIKAHIKLGHVSWIKLSDKDQERMAESRDLIRSTVLELAGMPDASISDVMQAFGIADNEIWGRG